MNISVEVPDMEPFDLVVREDRTGNTLIDFRLFGHLIYRRKYPFSPDNKLKIEAAMTDARRAFASRLANLMELDYEGE